MRTLPFPNITHTEVIRACTTNIHDKVLIDRVNENLDFFEHSSRIYKDEGIHNNFQSIPPHNWVNGTISKEQMVFLYNKMTNKKHVSRDYYDKLLHQSLKCPYCGYGKSKTLDHFLPKTIYPVYAVDPLNLVPCCRDCNTSKLTNTIGEDYQQLHAYFDNVDDDRWLYCEIGYFDTLAFKFIVKHPPTWEIDKYNKMQSHFNLFDLNALFIGFASDEFADSYYEMKMKVMNNESNEELEEYLELKFESCYRNLKNHWRTAMYDALKGNSEFYEWIRTIDI